MSKVLENVQNFPKVSALQPNLGRVLGLNPSTFTGPGTNTYVLGEKNPVLIDSGSGVKAYIDLLKAHIERHEKGALEAIFLTHAHPDHIGGVEDLSKVWPNIKVYKIPWSKQDKHYAANFSFVKPLERFSFSWGSLEAIHTPGHAPDHICYYWPQEKALFSGDLILGVGTTVIPKEEGSLALYMESLKKLKNWDIEKIYPGHGPVIENAQEKIEAYIAHREAREKQILHQLSLGKERIEDLVAEMYAEYPKNLHAAAGQSVFSHLVKLVEEKQVVLLEKDRYKLAAS